VRSAPSVDPSSVPDRRSRFGAAPPERVHPCVTARFVRMGWGRGASSMSLEEPERESPKDKGRFGEAAGEVNHTN
jgi:hypothetical protein